MKAVCICAHVWERSRLVMSTLRYFHPDTVLKFSPFYFWISPRRTYEKNKGIVTVVVRLSVSSSVCIIICCVSEVNMQSVKQKDFVSLPKRVAHRLCSFPCPCWGFLPSSESSQSHDPTEKILLSSGMMTTNHTNTKTVAKYISISSTSEMQRRLTDSGYAVLCTAFHAHTKDG